MQDFVNTTCQAFHSPKRKIKICKLKYMKINFWAGTIKLLLRAEIIKLMQKGQSTNWGGPIKTEQPINGKQKIIKILIPGMLDNT